MRDLKNLMHTGVLVAVLAWVLFPAAAQAFYNPSTGRWISRDPIEEGGGPNLCSFTENRPISNADRDGRDMVLRERFEPLQRSPSKDRYAGYRGLTFFSPFAPRTIVYQGLEGPCCWKIMLTGYADLYSWWVPGTFADDGTPSRTHEMQHVENARQAFREFVRSSSAFTGICLSRGKADCFARLATGELARAYEARYDTQNMEYDFRVLGEYESELPRQIQKEAEAWKNLAAAILRCMLSP